MSNKYRHSFGATCLRCAVSSPNERWGTMTHLLNALCLARNTSVLLRNGKTNSGSMSSRSPFRVVGSGAAIKMGSDGEADVLLVHSPPQEVTAMAAGDAISRLGLMYNDFIVVGPEDDPAGVKATGNNVIEAFKAISANGGAFVSRGDNSGTDTLEKSLWVSAGITPDPANYLEAATGMLATLTIAEQKYAYTITDRATYLKNLDKMTLPILCEGDALLLNPYSVMVVNPDKNDQINVVAATQFSDWLISDRGRTLINAYGVAEFGDPLFFFDYSPSY